MEQRSIRTLIFAESLEEIKVLELLPFKVAAKNSWGKVIASLIQTSPIFWAKPVILGEFSNFAKLIINATLFDA